MWRMNYAPIKLVLPIYGWQWGGFGMDQENPDLPRLTISPSKPVPPCDRSLITDTKPALLQCSGQVGYAYYCDYFFQ